MLRAFAPLLLVASCATAKPTAAPPDGEAAAPVAAELAIVDARVFDGERVHERATVLVDRGKIIAFGPDLAVTESAVRIDAAGMTLLPGLVDAHVHAHSIEELAQAAVFGVTTELDMMGDPGFAKAQRAKPTRTRTVADLRTAGMPVTAPGGHGTEYGVPIPTISSPDQVDAFVDARFDEGSDYLKIVYDDGFGPVTFVRIALASLRAAVAAAHRHKRLAIVHIGSAEEAAHAVGAGADGLAHLFLEGELDLAFVEAAKKERVFVTDTLAVLFSVCDGTRGAALVNDPRLAPWVPPAVEASVSRGFPLPEAHRPGCSVALATARRLHEAGVDLLASTDAPNPGTAHGLSMHDELALLVLAGLSPKDALAAATARPAARFGLDDRGRIAVGKRADLLLVRGDPTSDVTATRDIVGVWIGGRAVDREKWRERVALQREAERKQREAPPPAGSEEGLVSDFDAGGTGVRFGQPWAPSTDRELGGKSTVELTVVPGGAARSRGALELRGEIVQGGGPVAYAGAMFSPGETPQAAANLSKRSRLSLVAKGDPGTYVVMIRSTRGMATREFVVGRAWQPHVFALADFEGIEPHAIVGIFVGATGAPRRFSLRIDDVRIE